MLEGVEAAAQRVELGEVGCGRALERVQTGAEGGDVGGGRVTGGGRDGVDPGLEGGDRGAQRLDVRHATAQRGDLLAQADQIGSGRLQCGQLGTEGVEIAAALEGVELAAELGDLLGARGDVGAQGLERRQLGPQRIHAGAGGLGVAGQLLEATAILAGLGALDRDDGELLAQGVGLALDGLDALQRGGQLGAGGLGLADTVALEALDRGGELGLGGLRGLLVLGADLLELGDQLSGRDVAGGGTAALGLGQAGLDQRAGLVGAAAGLGDRLVGLALGVGDGGREAGVGGGGRLARAGAPAGPGGR